MPKQTNLVKYQESEARRLIHVVENNLWTTSHIVAEEFEKKHFHVLEAIRNMECSLEFSRSNFRLAEYIDEQGKSRRMYNISKDGLMFLVMGFTGRKAAEIKEKFIYAFNWMAEEIDLLRTRPQEIELTDRNINRKILETKLLREEELLLQDKQDRQLSRRLKVLGALTEKLNLSEHTKLGLYSSMAAEQGVDLKLLPAATQDRLKQTVTELLKDYETIIKHPREFNEIMVDLGYLEVVQRKSASSKTGYADFKVLVGTGLEYGVNATHKNAPENSSNPYYYTDTFSELLKIVESAKISKEKPKKHPIALVHKIKDRDWDV